MPLDFTWRGVDSYCKQDPWSYALVCVHLSNHLSTRFLLLFSLPGTWFGMKSELVPLGKRGSEVLFIIAPLNIKHIYDFYIIQIFITYTMQMLTPHQMTTIYYLCIGKETQKYESTNIFGRQIHIFPPSNDWWLRRQYAVPNTSSKLRVAG